VSSIAELAPLANRLSAKEPSAETPVVPIPVRRVDSESKRIELPRFLRYEPHPQTDRSRAPLFIVLIFAIPCLAIAFGALAFGAGDAVLPLIRNFARRFTTTRAASPQARIGPAMSINAIDALGQVQIRWNTSSSAIQAARSAVLSIVDGGPPQSIPLDGPHLQAGAFTYKRHGTRVDARLTLVTAGGSSVETSTTFLGPPTVEAEPAPVHVGAGALAEQNARLRRQLDEQIARNKTLQAQVDRLHKQHPPKKGP
jgi:hypothetical protein